MILETKQTTVAYRCPHCGSGVMSAVNPFLLKGSMVRLKCSCGNSVMEVQPAEAGKIYEVASVKQYLRIGRFGSLIKHISPVAIKGDGVIMRLIDRNFSMVDGHERYDVSGEALQGGISLAMQYSGTGYNPDIRVTGDGGSTLYKVTAKNNND